MRVLLSGHGEDRAALDAARRAYAHRVLVLFTPRPQDAGLARLRDLERAAGVEVEVHPVAPADLLGCLRAAQGVLAREARSDVRIHVGGGTNLVTSALLLAAFHGGREAFYCHEGAIRRLPVALEARLDDRVSAADRTVLVHLPPDAPIAIAEIHGPSVEPTRVSGALLRLRAAGLLVVKARSVALTPSGRAYRDHFLRMRGV